MRLQIIGKFSATVGEQPLVLSRKAQALLGHMALLSTPQLARARFVGLLWSEKDDQLAKGSLRQSLSEIQRTLKTAGCEPFQADPLNVTLNLSEVSCDAAEIISDAERGVVNPLLLTRERLTDDILGDLESVDPAYSTWLSETRPVLHERLISALSRLLPAEDQQDVTTVQEAAAKAIHRLDCENEQAVRVLIKAHAAAGNIGAALAVYARLWRRLEDEYDIEPHVLTQDLIAKLRLQQPASEGAPPFALPQALANPLTGLPPSRPSIAVLPFRSLTPNLEPHFSIGIADSVIQALSTMKELFVIARASSMIEVSATPDLRSVGRELNAQYLLHGSVQRSGDQIRITSELTASETLEVVRVDRLSGTVADIFDLQDRIAVEVIRSLAPQVRDRELNRAMQKKPDDLDAYHLTLLGYDQMFKADYTTFATALSNFERAHVLDPTWAPPLSYSSIWHMQRVARGWSADGQKELELARTLADRALERNSADGLANAVSAYTLSQCRHQHAAALQHLDRTIELIPNLALAFAFRAAVQIRCERYHEALNDAAIHLQLSPRDNLTVLTEMAISQAHFALGDVGTAIAHAKRVAALLPNNQANLRIFVAALAESGRFEEAAALVPSLTNQTSADVSWVATSPWPKAILVRIEAAFLKLAAAGRPRSALN